MLGNAVRCGKMSCDAPQKPAACLPRLPPRCVLASCLSPPPPARTVVLQRSRPTANVLSVIIIIITTVNRRRRQRRRAQLWVPGVGRLEPPEPHFSSSRTARTCRASALYRQGLTSAANSGPRLAGASAGRVTSAEATRKFTRSRHVVHACHPRLHTAPTVAGGAKEAP